MARLAKKLISACGKLYAGRLYTLRFTDVLRGFWGVPSRTCCDLTLQKRIRQHSNALRKLGWTLTQRIVPPKIERNFRAGVKS
jgi:hypothetical protein